MRSLVFFLCIVLATPALACRIEASSSFNNLVATSFWLAGLVLCLCSIFKFRKARKLKRQGLPTRPVASAAVTQLVTGILFIAFPFIQNAMQGTIVPVTRPIGTLNYSLPAGAEK